MILVVIVSFFFGFQTGQKQAKHELSESNAYYCKVDKGYRRCYTSTLDPYSVEKYDERSH